MERTLSLLLCCALASMATIAQETPDRGNAYPRDVPDGSWIGISGRVESTSSGSFMLNYGNGTIKVELQPTATNLHDFIKDEEVDVYGIVDDGFFKRRTIKAHAVYVESLRSYVCTLEGSEAKCASFAPEILSGVVVHGRVTRSDGRTIRVDEGDREIAVDVSSVAVNEAGQEKPVVGDMVTVLGFMDDGFFSQKLKASSITIVH